MELSHAREILSAIGVNWFADYSLRDQEQCARELLAVLTDDDLFQNDVRQALRRYLADGVGEDVLISLVREDFNRAVSDAASAVTYLRQLQTWLFGE